MMNRDDIEWLVMLITLPLIIAFSFVFLIVRVNHIL